MPANPFPLPVEPDGVTPIPRTAPYDVSSFMNPMYNAPLRKAGIGYGDSQYGSPVPMNLRRSLGKSKETERFGKVINVRHQKGVYQAGKRFSKSQNQSAGGLQQKLKYIDWTNPYKTQDVSQDGVVYCPKDPKQTAPRYAYDSLFNISNSRSFNSSLAVGGSQDSVAISACDITLPVKLAEQTVVAVTATRIIQEDGSVVVSKLPVSGDIIVTNLDEISAISVDNFPAVQQVSGALSFDTSATLTVSGSIEVNNLAEVSSVKVNNLSEVSSLAVNNFPSTQAVSGSIEVNNLAEVSSVGVNNFPSGFVASGTPLDNANTSLSAINVIVDANKAVVTNILTKNTEIDTALDLVKTNSDASVDNTANVLTLKRQVVNSAPAGLEIQTGSGGLTTSSLYSPKNATLLSVLIDLDTVGGSPVTNTTLVSAGGSGTRISVYGWNLSMIGTTSTSLGNWVITNGDVAGGKYLSGGMVISNVPTHQCKDLTLPLSCDDNTALKITTTESTGNMYLYGTVQYRIETI